MNPTSTPLIAQLTKYAAYHRDPRNIATHFFGVPTILFAVTCFLARPAVEVGGLVLSPVWLAVTLATLFYLRLDVRFGLTMLALLVLSAWGATQLAAQSTGLWLGLSAGLFLGGWVVQFIGHSFEGKKPAFVDDLVGLLVGPLFVVAEAGFALGLRRDVQAAVEQNVGPVRHRTGAGASAALDK
jgi:uncharacterized membrane protein YGL010W